MATEPQVTDFTRDVLGRYVCNSFEEAIESTRGGSSPFHYIVIGGGLFGGTVASFLAGLDPSFEAFDDAFPRYHSRILVLEAGPFVLAEHEQNVAVGPGVPGSPTSLADLRRDLPPGTQPGARNEIWGLAWHSNEPFIGAAYCVGGKSLFWGGWAPRFLRTEMPTGGNSEAKWPQRVVDELEGIRVFEDKNIWDDAAHQLGVDDPNDFVNGELHEVMRDLFYEAVRDGRVSNMIPLAELPQYVDRRRIAGDAPPEEKLKLDAPYAVQATTRSGFFPFNKFSSVPLVIGASRQAAAQSQKTADKALNDSRRQFMVVPNCHVKRLRTLPVGAARDDIRRVVAVETNLGDIDVAHNAAVILATGAIEDARLALNSFAGARSYASMGKNLMAHVRSDAFVTVPRDVAVDGRSLFAALAMKQVEMSAVQLRGRIRHADGTNGHFHLQVVASGIPANSGSADSEIFRKVPDIDQFEFFRDGTKDERIAIAIRGIGEMSPMNVDSEVLLDREVDEFGVPRAFVRINDDGDSTTPGREKFNAKDRAVRDAMRTATSQVASLFGENLDPVAGVAINELGTTYHEAGTLRMGDDPDNSAVDADQRFHGVTNAYVASTATLPTCGSANPVQPGVALVRRLALHLAQPRLATVPPEGMFLFQDTPTPFWRLAGAPADAVTFGLGELELRSSRGPSGVYWCTIPTPPDFELSVDWLSTDQADNSGVFIRFPDLDRPSPGAAKVFTQPAFIAVEYGFEVQIDGLRRGGNPTFAGPGGGTSEVVDPRFRGTGAIYNEPSQQLADVGTFEIGAWHTFVIRAIANRIDVDGRIRGGPLQQLTRFTYDASAYPPGDQRRSPDRGRPTREGRDSGAKRYVGLQVHPDTRLVKVRNVFIKPV